MRVGATASMTTRAVGIPMTTRAAGIPRRGNGRRGIGTSNHPSSSSRVVNDLDDMTACQEKCPE